VTLFTTALADRSKLRDALVPGQLAVLFLCAAWCDICREFHRAAQRLAAAHPDIAFVWLDIEDDETIVGEVDVENFPTLAIVRGDIVLHFGVSLPHEAGVARLIEEMAARGRAASGIPDGVRAMVVTLRNEQEPA
jgi:thioredoxin 1